LPFPRSRTGFTLPEVLAVVVIIGILATLAAPRLDVSRYRSETAAQAAAGAFLVAQRAAVARGHDVIVGFDVAGRRLRIHQDDDNDGRIDDGERVRFEPLPTGAVFGRGGAGANHPRLGTAAVSFTALRDGLPALIFNRSGSTSEEGGVYLTSAVAEAERNRPMVSRAVVVERASGRPVVARYTPAGWKDRS
jgi:prepilin-type N-terminal cleavage/methylation domain-containing protein